MFDSRIITYDVVVIGGGPAGMMAAGHAAERGASVLLIEKNPSLGKKLQLASSGRCNFTNMAEPRAFRKAYGSRGRFLGPALTALSNRYLTAFFEMRGMRTRVDSEGRVFPEDNRTESVLAVLQRYLEENGVSLLFHTAVMDVVCRTEENQRVGGVMLDHGPVINAESVVIATGGMSYPSTGSSGAGYALAKKCGHSVVPLKPGLGAPSLPEAMITVGGIPLREIDKTTMESKLVFGLYLCGEIIDVDGPDGGYNLHAAFATGYLAGESAAFRSCSLTSR